MGWDVESLFPPGHTLFGRLNAGLLMNAKLSHDWSQSNAKTFLCRNKYVFAKNNLDQIRFNS